MHIMVKVVLWCLSGYLIYCGFLFLVQRQMLFPRGLIGPPPTAEPKVEGLERIWLPTTFGKVEAWYIPPHSGSATPAPVVIFAHGNAELIDFWPEQFKGFSQLGLGLLLVEYPGYGRSAGSPSQATIGEVFQAAYDSVVLRRDVDPARVVLFGRSLGGGAVCALAAQRPSAAIVLMSTFTSTRAMASKYLAPGILVRDPFDNLSVVKTYPEPVLIVHGKGDDLIPFAHGLKLFETAIQGKLLAYDCAHNDCPPEWDTFWQDMAIFLLKAGIIEKRAVEKARLRLP